MGRRPTASEHNALGVFFYSRQAYDLAIKELRRAMQLASRPSPMLHVNLGAAYLGKGLHAEARGCFERALALDPGHQKARWFLARTLQATGAVEAAQTEFERAARLDPASPEGRWAAQEARALAAALDARPSRAVAPSWPVEPGIQDRADDSG
jgi:Tfp pilus assembly protein PilF